jgi:small subunit ribosomal protein S16
VLRIRLSRTGKTRQESFRIVVAPHTNAVKGKYIELIGHYNNAVQPKKLEIKRDRVEYWISQGAKPSESLAALFKRNGFANMDQYIPARVKTERPKKKEAGKDAPAAAAAPKVAKAPKAEAPEAPKAEEPKAAEAPAQG